MNVNNTYVLKRTYAMRIFRVSFADHVMEIIDRGVLK